MLHIITNYKHFLQSFIIIKLVGANEGLSGNNDNIQKTIDKKYLGKMEKDFILNFDIKKDIRNKNLLSPLQISLNSLGFKGKNGKVLKEDSKWGENTSFALENAKKVIKLNEIQKVGIIDGTKIGLTQVLSTDKVVENKVNTEEQKVEEQKIEEQSNILKTKESFGFIKGTFGKKIEGPQLREIVNVNSINDFLSTKSGDELLSFLKKITLIANKNNLDNNLYSFTPFNISEISDEFISNGYEADGLFGGEELGALFQIVEDFVKTQNSIPLLNYKDKIGVILDYNIDGILDDNVHFYTKEKEFFRAIRSEGEFNNLLINLGYNGTSDFNEQFSKNYFKARKEFKARLSTALDSKLNVNPAEMLDSKTGVLDQVKLFNETVKTIEGNKKFKEIEKKDKKLADQIKYEGAGVIVGSVKGAAVSFDISEATNKLIDSMQFGVINGVLGFGLAKRVIDHKDGTFTLDVGVINFIPYVAASAKLYESKLADFKDLFPKKIDDGVKVSLGGVISINSMGAVGLDFSKIDENTKDGMEKMRNNMSLALDNLFDLIVKGSKFEEVGINDTKENRNAYNRLSSMYKSFGPSGIQFLKEGALNNYSRELYENAKGFHFVGISIGVAKALTYVVPLIGVHGEYNSTNWKQTQEGNINEKTGNINSQSASINTKKASSEVNSDKIIGAKTNSVETVKYSSELVKAVNALDASITSKTRTNKFAYEIMDPNGTLDSKWEGFKNFANRPLKYSKELNSTISSFKNVLDKTDKKGVTANEKWYILSTVVQLMKKSNDAHSGNLDEYNKNYESIINMNNKRRKGFNKLLGFNTDKISTVYDNKLIAAGQKGKISEVNLSGISFDASATKNVGLDKKTLSGVDVFYSNLQVLSNANEAILVPLTDKSDIEGFKKTINNLNTLSKENKEDFIKGIDSGKIQLNYYRDPDGFDDRILLLNNSGALLGAMDGSSSDSGDSLKDKKIDNNTDLAESRLISVYKPAFDTDSYGIVFALDKKDTNTNKVVNNGDNGAGSQPIDSNPTANNNAGGPAI